LDYVITFLVLLFYGILMYQCGTKENVPNTNRLFIQSHSAPLNFQMFIYWAILDLNCICWREI